MGRVSWSGEVCGRVIAAEIIEEELCSRGMQQESWLGAVEEQDFIYLVHQEDFNPGMEGTGYDTTAHWGWSELDTT